jgi:GntR family transcriptional regulator/MocR family aminotransferase
MLPVLPARRGERLRGDSIQGLVWLAVTALVTWAKERGATIIEDDYDAESRYDRDPVGALQGLAPDRVALIGTVSKSLAPALRLGWVVCPGALLESLTEDKRLSDRGSPTLEQLALATLIESGRYDRHLRRMRGVYAARRDTRWS